MKRSASVTIAAVFSLLGSALSLALGLLSALAVLIARKSNPDLNEPLVLGGVVIGTFFLIVPAIWGIATSRGLFRLKAWARTSILVFSVLLAITGLFGAILFPLLQHSTTPESAGSGFTYLKFGIGGFYAVLAGIGVWWFVLFTRPSVRQQFGIGTTESSSAANQSAYDYPRAKAASSGV
jgi:hypothetical protein